MDIEIFVIRISGNYWKNGVNSSEALRLTCEFEGKRIMNCKLAQSLYRLFDSSNMIILDKPKSDRHRSLSLELISYMKSLKT